METLPIRLIISVVVIHLICLEMIWIITIQSRGALVSQNADVVRSQAKKIAILAWRVKLQPIVMHACSKKHVKLLKRQIVPLQVVVKSVRNADNSRQNRLQSSRRFKKLLLMIKTFHNLILLKFRKVLLFLTWQSC